MGGAGPEIIAELGVGHGGSVDEALRRVQELRTVAYCDTVKIQTHIADEEMTPCHPLYSTIKSLELSEADEALVKASAEEAGFGFLSTPFSVAAVERLERLGVERYKIGSGEVSNVPLLEAVRDTGKPVLMSTGMHRAAEVEAAIRIVGADRVTPMICISKYPVVGSDVLGLWGDGGPGFPAERGRAWGWSDHTGLDLLPTMAVTLGASVVEIHVRWTESEPDAAAAQTLGAFANTCNLLRSAWDITHGPAAWPDQSEVSVWAKHRIVAREPIRRGDVLTEQNMCTKRTGKPAGISAAHWHSVIGRRATVDHGVNDLVFAPRCSWEQ